MKAYNINSSNLMYIWRLPLIIEVYTAFRKAGVPEQEAQDAAEALSNETTATKADIGKLEKQMIEINGEIKVIKWMIGLVIVINVIPLFKGTILN